MRSARGRGCGGVQGNESSWQMSGREDMRSARGRRGNFGHFFAGSIAVGAGEQSRSRRRECGCGCGGVGKERAGVCAVENRGGGGLRARETSKILIYD